MTPEQVMTMTYEALTLAFALAAPLLVTTLVVGLTVSIFQAATQINEMTLSFIPKLLAVGLAIVVAGPWMLGELVDYIRALLINLPQVANAG